MSSWLDESSILISHLQKFRFIRFVPLNLVETLSQSDSHWRIFSLILFFSSSEDVFVQRIPLATFPQFDFPCLPLLIWCNAFLLNYSSSNQWKIHLLIAVGIIPWHHKKRNPEFQALHKHVRSSLPVNKGKTQSQYLDHMHCQKIDIKDHTIFSSCNPKKQKKKKMKKTSK